MWTHSDKMYLNRDPRFYATIYYDGVTVQLENSEYGVPETFVGGNCGLSLSPSSRRNTCTGYYLHKFNNAQSSTSGNKDGYIRMFRLAELYLNFAEAAYRAHGADWQAPATEVLEMEEGDDGETVEKLNTYGTPMSAREAVNAVRARVGMPGVADDGEALWLQLCNERRVGWLSRSTASSTCAAGRRPGRSLEDRPACDGYAHRGVERAKVTYTVSRSTARAIPQIPQIPRRVWTRCARCSV